MHGPVIPEVCRRGMVTILMTLIIDHDTDDTENHYDDTEDDDTAVLMMTPASIRVQVEPKKCRARPKVILDFQK